jgi:outer membrane usher protein
VTRHFNTENIGTRASLWHEFRYFSGNMTFSSTGTAISRLSGQPAQQDGYTRYDTTLHLTDEDNAIQWSVGM